MPSSWDRPPTGSPYPQPPRKRRWPWLVGSAVIVLLLAAVFAAAGAHDDDTTQADVTTSSTASVTPTATSESAAKAPAPLATIDTAVAANAALAKLNTLAVKGRAPKTGYERTAFGEAWTDDVNVESGHNGCETRNDILRRDLVNITIKPGSKGCTVEAGTLNDPYTSTSFSFVRGQDTSARAQIDHVVALSNAWQTGAQQLTLEKRTDLANDPRNLQATDGPTNQQKGDGDAATWLPPNKSHRCTYVGQQVTVKAAYDLWVTQPEKDAITRVLTECGAIGPTTTTTSTIEPVQTRAPAAPRTSTPVYTPPPPTAEYTPPPPPPPVVDAPASVYYPDCAAAKAAGAAPISAGEPGYRPGLDGDRDGIACDKS
ncbi:MAG: deoxyribonuclease [Gordonia sp. (in: high G+C Gram-positive bacteria)]|nr:MAG: deoxyribonuclease [Gordonia sp. (in: high G+C Gram-positive bacteria)]